MMGAPTEPAAVAVPVTNPTRDSGGSQRFWGRTGCTVIVQAGTVKVRDNVKTQSYYGQ